jgi:aspartyl-tRNA(Asn)/glutamyl-tRNA(Gln) amidotransferase subunit C
MEIDPHHIARLARIRLSDDEAERLGRDLSRVLDWAHTLSSVQIDPMLVCVDQPGAAMRKDEVLDVPQRQEILSGAPQSFCDFFVVPKVLS